MQMSRAKPESKSYPKRFYHEASLGSSGEYFCVLLDGKAVRTPAQHKLHHPSHDLMQHIVAEWNAQEGHIDPESMPLTRLLTISCDRMQQDRPAVLADMLRYVETDLLCYRASATDDAMRQLQQQQADSFDPVLTWVARTYGVAVRVTEGVMPVAQDGRLHAAIASALDTASNAQVAALAMLTPLLGSLLLALAVWQGACNIEEALRAARLDEGCNEARYGADPEAQRAWESACRDARACVLFLTANALKNS